ncbi:hypothetical protein OE88DRAFT_1655981 [Heliocybe sulcata]|uniref:F-box domain-containing protein n=1 Tax=Heliocybe sulcata TaxID=5364 RepID=A0A5C3N7N8_9AGAM|nr:hypothetical protein OE88DRAFT_1655981 [Heliocybe sulcata]
MPSTADPGWWKTPEETSRTILPPETWIRIFELATIVPWALETETRDPFGVSAPLMPREERDALNRSFVTKRALVLVCKQWWKLSLPFLYEIVTAHCQEGLSRLYRTLIESSDPADVVEARLINVRRIHCTLDPEESFYYNWTNLAKIIQNSPNLVIFNIHARGHATRSRYEMSWRMVAALKLRSGTLRVLDWDLKNVTGMEGKYERRLLAHLPNLRILHVSGDKPWLFFFPQPSELTPVSMPYLVSTSWARQGCSSHLTVVDELPSLHSLEIAERINPNMNGLPPTNICSSITSLTLHGQDMPWDPNDYGLQCAYKALPNITQLVLWMYTWENFPFAASLPPGIEKLGLGGQERKPSKNSVYKQLFENLYTIKASGLRVVRFIGGGDWSLLPQRSPKVLLRLQELAPTRSFRVARGGPEREAVG